MHGKFSLHCFHLRPLEVWRLLEWLGSMHTLLGKGACQDNQELDLRLQLVVAMSYHTPPKAVKRFQTQSVASDGLKGIVAVGSFGFAGSN